MFVYDKALTEKEVSQLYKSLTDPQVVAESQHVALDDNDNIIASIDENLTKGTADDMRGWYYVNSTSKWEKYYENPEVGTSKVLAPVPNEEVIPNYISLDNLPQNIKSKLDATPVQRATAGLSIREATTSPLQKMMTMRSIITMPRQTAETRQAF